MNRNDVIDVLSVVAAATRRTVGQADVTVWESVIGNLNRSQALRAVRDHLRERPGVWLEPGHVYERVRAMRRDELARMDPDERPVRDVAVPEPIRALSESKAIPAEFARPSRRPEGNALAVPCPFCHADIGRPCTVGGLAGTKRGDTRKTPHPSRLDAATTSRRAVLTEAEPAKPAESTANADAENDKPPNDPPAATHSHQNPTLGRWGASR